MKKTLKILLCSLLVLFIFINIITAFHAYKFTHFYDIGQVAIIKNENKTGWEKTKEILFGINAVKQKNSAPDSVYEKVIIKTKDDIKLQGWYVKLKDSAKGTVILFHGHGSKNPV